MNNFSIRWKLVFVAAATLVLAAGVPSFTAAWAKADVFAPARDMAPVSVPLKAFQTQPQSPANSMQSRASFRAALPNGIEQSRRLSPGAIIGLICAIAASSVALGVAFGLRRRIDRIAGPDPDKADDD